MLEIPHSWRVSVAYILEKYQAAKVLVVGDRDTGKSTYCRFLIGELGKAGQQVSFVDADIGQKDLGPPGTISLGTLEEDGLSISPQPVSLYFVGSVNPRGNFLPMIIGTREMTDLAKTPFTIINTTGFIEGSGRTLKIFKIESVRPNVIIALQKENELESLLEEVSYIDTIRLKSSQLAHGKSLVFRTEARRQAFIRYFQNSKSIHLGKAHFITQRRDDKSLLGRLCGLASSNGRCLGVAIVHNDSPESIEVISPVTEVKISVLQLGNMWLGPEWNELN
jgi:polynucleotide 5'-hydroxyl-kinase GRC3/NOL9